MFKKRLKSFSYAGKGLAELFRSQPNSRIHLLFILAVVLAGWFFGLTPTEWLVLVLTMTIVLAAESFNTALEYLTDLASPGFHPLAGKVKDLAAGAVLICALGAVIVGMIIFFPYLLALIND